jgi:uncharacterized membrane protein YozB (DUF420 family)
MVTAPRIQTPPLVSLKKVILLIVGGLALYFLYDQAQYFVWSEESYGYYWTYRTPLAFHLAGGVVALLAGVFQLWSGLNASAMRTHPWTGRVYVGAVIVGALGGIGLAFSSVFLGIAWDVALVSLALAWLAVTGTAFLCIRRRNLKAHKEWMIRSYIITFAFVSFRIIVDYVPYTAWWGISNDDMALAMIWPVWVVPLLVYEISLQSRNLGAERAVR